VPLYGSEGIPNTFVWIVAMVGACLEVEGVGYCTVVASKIFGGTFSLLVDGVGS
jgi:hypothetical protein